MKKIVAGLLSLVVLFSWTYIGLSRKPASSRALGENTQGQENQAKEELAKKLVIQQQESRENLRRLAEGQIKSIEVTKVDKGQNQVFIKAFYADQTALDGRMDFEAVDGKTYLTRVTRLDNIPLLPGQSVANVGPEELALGEKLIDSQAEDQSIVNDLLEGKGKRLDVSNVIQGNNTSTIEGTFTEDSGATKPFKIEMVLDQGFWYVKSAS